MRYIRAFEQSVERGPDSVAIEHPGGSTYTYAELHQRTTELALALNERTGDERSGSLLANGQPAIEILLAAYKRGVANVPLNTQSSIDQQIFMLENGDVSSLIFDEENRETAVKILERCDIDTGLYISQDSVEIKGCTVEPYETALGDITANADAYQTKESEGGIYYTSGTTGKPKGVVADQTKSWHASSQLVMDSAIEPDDTALIATPLYHVVTAISWTFAHLQANATIIPQTSFSPGESLDLIADHDVTNVFLIPAQWDAILEEQRANPRAVDTIKQARTGGAPVDEEAISAVRELICDNFYVIYGLTESISNVTVGRPSDQRQNPGTVGQATINWSVRIVEPVDPPNKPDPESVVEPPGTGELLARSPVAADGYLDRPEAEEELFVDGWIRTGDTARIDEDRNLYIIDRIDNMIISGGENIYPQEVENTLIQHPNVEEAAVIGIPDEKWGETVKAIVVSQSSNVTSEDLDTFCKESEQLANFKRPRKYELVNKELPRSPLGKFRRGVIRDRYSP